jgi:formate dehydrogenase subunit gamma
MASAGSSPPEPGFAAQAADQRDAAEAAVTAAIERESGRPGALLPVLHAVQERLGYIPAHALPRIAKALNLSRAEVHGVVSFYHDFRSAPPGRHVLRLCLAEACQAMGAQALRDHVEAALKLELPGTSADRALTLEPVYCLGNCACAPSIMIDDVLHGRVTAEHFDAIAARLREEA